MTLDDALEAPAPRARWTTRLATRLADVLFGTEPRVRARVRHQFMATLAYIGCTLTLVFSIRAGMVPAQPGWALVAFLVIGQGTFYALMRSGWSERCQDSGLMLPQNVFALVAIASAYSLNGVAKATPLILITQVLIYGMFSLKPRQIIGLGAFTVLLLGSVMGLLAHFDPQHYPSQQELTRFVMAASIFPVISLAAHYTSRLRQRLVEHKTELRAALARAQELATHDMLTGLVNRMHMQSLLEKECSRQDRHGGAFSTALIDLDFFKRVNDEHGHAAGDAVLKGFAQVAADVLRTCDVVGRWGGEEFLVLFPATDLHQAQIGLQRLRERLRQTTLVESHPTLRVNFSAGLAGHLTEESISDTLERADRALYQAKEGGRGRDVVAA